MSSNPKLHHGFFVAISGSAAFVPFIEDISKSRLFKEPLSQREAYVWLSAFSPVQYKAVKLSAMWGWNKSKTRRFIQKLVASGLLKYDGLSLLAIAPDLAVPSDADDQWRTIRQTVFRRDRFKCTYCGSTEKLECDHILARVRGGTDILKNLTTSCKSCNASKRDKLLSEWRGRRKKDGPR